MLDAFLAERKGSSATSPESKCAAAQQHSHKGRTMFNNITWYALQDKNN